MDTSRLKRYKDKLDLIAKRKGEIEEWKADFLEDEKTMLACYKAFQEAAEASMDVLSMVARDSDVIPKDDYSNIDLAVDIKILDKKLADNFKQMNGLRNRLVHEYNGLNVELAFESMIELLPTLDEFLEVMEKWLQKA